MTDRTFVSYARKDQGFVLELATALKERGVPLWLDQWDIPAGADWDRTIDNALNQCTQVLIVLSPAAVESPQVRGELQTALDEHKPIVPVIYQPCPMPRPLRLIQHVDLTHGLSDESAMAQLMHALQVPQILPPSPAQHPREPFSKRGWLFGLTGGLLAAVLLSSGLWYLWYPPPDGGAPSRNGQKPHSSELLGNLQVNVNVDAAKVSIDGVEVGTARRSVPLLLSDIKAGQRRVLVQAEGWEPQERRVTIQANQWVQLGFELWQRPP